MVYVINKNGQPLMPCENVIARLLLKERKAKVIMRCPFAIKLNYNATEYYRVLTHAEDTGSGTLGSAVSDEYGNIYYQAEIQVRNDIKPKMDQRRMYRRSRRGRKTRHRKPRFNNRASSKRKGRLNPTMVSKIEAHEREIRFVSKILPISKIVFETGQFDPAALKDPSIRSKSKVHWAYQKGIQYGFENLKAAVRSRDGYICQKCGKKKGRMEVHHINPRSKGGADIAENLVTVCPDCHEKIHSGKIPNFTKERDDLARLKDAIQMNVIRSQLLKRYPEATEVFGYITSANLTKFGIEKSHANDAAVVASNGIKPTFKNDVIYYKRCNSKGDYKKTMGDHSEIRLTTGKLHGINKYDKVSYFGAVGFVKGKMVGKLNKNGTKGDDYAILMDIDGNKIDFSFMPKGYKTPKIKNLKRIRGRTSWMTMKRKTA